MDWTLLLRGITVGFAIAAPVGPIGLLCIQRTLAQGRRAGLVTGLGAASADAVYGLIAGLGLTAVAAFLAGHQLWLALVGGLFLCYLGVRTLLSTPATQAAKVDGAGYWGAYASTFVLTLTNPLTIFSFLAVFAGLGLATAGGAPRQALALVVGVFVGSALWWLLLSSGVSLLRRRLGIEVLLWVNRVAGAVLIGFGLYLLVDLAPGV